MAAAATRHKVLPTESLQLHSFRSFVRILGADGSRIEVDGESERGEERLGII